MTENYIGRFAPSPTGLLHAGSLVAALASFIDAKAHHGKWLIRIEDVDQTRCKKEWAEGILSVLDRLEMKSDGPILWQSQRTDRYLEVIDQLIAQKKVYGCSCTRHTIEEENVRLGAPLNHYPGTCRQGPHGTIRSWRFLTNDAPITFTDRWSGHYSQNVEKEVGDFGVTDIVRGADLIDNTPRQLAIYRALGWKEPTYMHIPLVLNDRHEKLSKQGGARPLSENLLEELNHAWHHLGFTPISAKNPTDFYNQAIPLWQNRFQIAK